MHSNGDEVSFVEAKVSNNSHADKAALATGVCHNRYLDVSLAYVGWVDAKAFIVLWAECGCEGDDWLWFGRLTDPTVV